MLGVEVLVLFVLRPRQMRRMWPALLPMVLVIHFAVPGKLGTLANSFFPKGGIFQEEKGINNTGRLGKARLDPTFAALEAHQFLGIGYGSRKVGNAGKAQILDDQWLDNALDTGILGVLAWMWLLIRFVRRVGAQARNDLSEYGWLLTVLVAAVSGYGVSMLLYDAFGFIQVTFVFYTLIALGAVLALDTSPVREAVRRPGLAPASLAAGGLGFIGLGISLMVFNLLLGPSLRFLTLVLILMACAWWLIERTTLVQGRSEAAPPAR
jgi:hypothetical protein